MVFSSPVFLFVFLPLALAAYVASPRAARNATLLVLSLAFYAWGERGYVLLMMLSIGANYVAGRTIEAGRGRPWGDLVLAAAVAANLLVLIHFKYANFLVENLNNALTTLRWSPMEWKSVHLPIGISFFTFEAIAYLVDIRREVTDAQRDPIKFGLFMTLFPHLIAGPVVRYRDLEAALSRRVITRDQFSAGVRRFIIGLAKKVLLANTLAKTADLVFDQAPGNLEASAAWLGVVCYTLHIYFDFSGYSDMAIGLGRFFGFELCENFRYPYVATSVTDFWRRWHISLSTWFRDYLYIPLGGNRRGNIRTIINLFVVFACCGLWHGASWNFLVWGLFHGLFLAIERIGANPPRITGHAKTLLVVMIGWVFFRAENLNHAIEFLRALIGVGGAGHRAADYGTRELLIALTIGVVAAMPLAPMLMRWRDRVRSRGDAVAFLVEWGQSAVLLLVLAACVVSLAAGTFNPFIYFRF